MKIKYDYPVYIYDDENNGEKTGMKFTYSGEIRMIRMRKESYEATVGTRGSSFHILFGPQINGYFLCVPNWQFGCEMAEPDDIFWNLHSIRSSGKDTFTEEDAAALAYAVKELNKHI